MRGKPAMDVHPYLGALAHAFFLDAGDRSSVHVHPVLPGVMGSASTTVYPDDEMLAGASLHVASFVLTAAQP